MKRDLIDLVALEHHFSQAVSSLRCAWKICKDKEMEKVEKEIADTVLDLENWLQQIKTLNEKYIYNQSVWEEI